MRRFLRNELPQHLIDPCLPATATGLERLDDLWWKPHAHPYLGHLGFGPATGASKAAARTSPSNCGNTSDTGRA
jgi:hypothetical protein